MASTDAASEPQSSTASADAASTAADAAAGGGSGAGGGGSGSITEMSAEQLRALLMQVQRVDPMALRQAALGGDGTPADQEEEEVQSGSAAAAAVEGVGEGGKDAEEKVEVSNAPNEDGADTEERVEEKNDQSEKKTKKKNSDKKVTSVEELTSKERPMPTEETPSSSSQPESKKKPGRKKKQPPSAPAAAAPKRARRKKSTEETMDSPSPAATAAVTEKRSATKHKKKEEKEPPSLAEGKIPKSSKDDDEDENGGGTQGFGSEIGLLTQEGSHPPVHDEDLGREEEMETDSSPLSSMAQSKGDDEAETKEPSSTLANVGPELKPVEKKPPKKRRRQDPQSKKSTEDDGKTNAPPSDEKDEEGGVKTFLAQRTPLSEHRPPRRVRYRNRKIKSAKPTVSSLISMSDTDQPEGSVDAAEATEEEKRLPYWDTLGKCHLSHADDGASFSFADEDFLGYDAALGRVYYRSFVLRGRPFSVGDFVRRRSKQTKKTDFFRVIGAYRATKSFVGIWTQLSEARNGKTEVDKDEIQKRGHPYVVVVPLLTADRVGAKLAESGGGAKGGGKKELILCGDMELTPGHVDALPQWLGEDEVNLKKVSVRVVPEEVWKEEKAAKDNKGPLSFFCSRVLLISQEEVIPQGEMTPTKRKRGRPTKGTPTKGTPTKGKKKVSLARMARSRSLTSEHVSLLRGSAEDLISGGFVPTEWDPIFKAERVQFVHNDRPDEDDDDEEEEHQKSADKVRFWYTADSSDDSDGFAEDDEGGDTKGREDEEDDGSEYEGKEGKEEAADGNDDDGRKKQARAKEQLEDEDTVSEHSDDNEDGAVLADLGSSEKSGPKRRTGKSEKSHNEQEDDKELEEGRSSQVTTPKARGGGGGGRKRTPTKSHGSAVADGDRAGGSGEGGGAHKEKTRRTKHARSKSK